MTQVVKKCKDNSCFLAWEPDEFIKISDQRIIKYSNDREQAERKRAFVLISKDCRKIIGEKAIYFVEKVKQAKVKGLTRREKGRNINQLELRAAIHSLHHFTNSAF